MMLTRSSCVLYFFLVALVPRLIAQENIPVGTWREHLSFNDLNCLSDASDRVFAANEVGLMILNKSDDQITTMSKIDGLSGSTITSIAYDDGGLLLIGFEDGLINLIARNKLSVFNNLAISSAISGSRRINHININSGLAFLSTDFGVVVFDLNKNEVMETYRDLGETGETLKILESVVFQDSLYLATEKGVLAGSLNGMSNLLDFRSWKRYSSGTLDNSIESIVVFNNVLYVAINAQGIFKLQGGTWTLQSYLQSEEFKKLSSLDDLIITTVSGVWRYDGASLMEIATNELTKPNEATQSSNGMIWIADGEKGLISVVNGAISSAKPNGPSSNSTKRITYTEDKIISSKGGFSNTLTPLNNHVNVDQFFNGQWSTITTTLQNDITDQSQTSNAIYFSSFGYGLEKISGGSSLIFDDSNSPLLKNNSKILIPSIEASNDGVWIANYGVATPLHFLSNNLEWQSFPIAQSQFPVELLVDKFNRVWMTIDPTNGGGVIVFDKSSNQSVHLATMAGGGGLPSASVRSLANDREGQVWLGTDEGVVYFSNPGVIFNNNVDAVRPIFENHFLLRDEAVTAIAVDGGNRKWLGTNNGVWLFSPNGEELVYNFTEENSPLLSNKIASIAIDPKNGEIFFATEKGISSFRSTATKSSFQFSDVKIFPNPVSADFIGQVAINGLYTDAIVKITDIGGRLIWQTRANGGTATWDARQLNGRKVSTGIYLVFATAEDGSERHVGKIAVIE